MSMPAVAAQPSESTLEVLHEVPGLPRFDLPARLREAYGGDLGFERPRLVANFVSTIDGVAAIPDLAQSNKLIADASESDRFLMGLLRACADAVVIGSGTLRGSPTGLWTPALAYPAAADDFAGLRRLLDLPAAPEVAVLTGTGLLPESHPLFNVGALVLTTDRGAERLDGRLPPASTVVSLGDSRTVDVHAAVATLRARGHELILSEAGPRVFAALLAAGLVDELFLTVSPLVAGRGSSSRRLGLVEGFEALPGDPVRADLLSVRRQGAHLFLRYELERQAPKR
jgi:riboflavin biosynthesis pyrimidine reductase